MYLNLLGTGFPALTPELGYLGNHTSKTNDNIFSFLKVVIIPSPYLVALDETYRTILGTNGSNLYFDFI